MGRLEQNPFPPAASDEPPFPPPSPSASDQPPFQPLQTQGHGHPVLLSPNPTPFLPAPTQGYPVPPPNDQTVQPPPPQGYRDPSPYDPTVQPPPPSPEGYPVPPSSDQPSFAPPPGNRLPTTSHQSAFLPVPQGYQVPQPSNQTPLQPPPESYPTSHNNLWSLPPQQSTHSCVNESTKSPPPSQLCPPQQQPVTYYPPPEQSPGWPPVANGTSYDPQVYNSTPNHSCQPQAVTGYQFPATPGTPNWHQPPPAITIQEWSTGLFECLEEPENAIMTLCFPCVTFGQIAEIADNGQTSCATSALLYYLVMSCIGIPCIMSCSYRTKVRSRYNLLETPAPDWVIHLFCEYCALCQEYRELKNRGMDPAIGWQGNLSKHQQMANYATMAPPTNQRMTG